MENYQEYVSKYAIGDDSYLVYLDTYIIDRVWCGQIQELSGGNDE